MIEYTLDRETAILHVHPLKSLAEEDFNRVAAEIDPFIETHGGLNGIVLEFQKFPGWEGLGAAICHFHFVKDHHKKVKKIAVVTDSPIGSIAEHITSHFVAATIRHFDAENMADAKQWLLATD